MKTSKRILCSLVLLVFAVVNIFVMPVSAASFTDVKDGSDVHEAVTVLNKLGVINGYDDGTFKPDNNVTRAEFTAMLLRTRGLGTAGSMSLENPPFPDVVSSDVSWAIGNIRTARDMGIINGYDDGTFKPNNNVSYEEAIKMIVCALGYGEMGAEGAAWYSRYLMTATQLKFTNGVGGAVGTPATRATIANMLYNCLEVKLAENNQITTKTILEDDLGLTKQVGFIASNPSISLSAPDPSVREDEIEITAPDEDGIDQTLAYKCDNVEDYADMLGAQITFYSKEDRSTGKVSLVMASVKDSNTVKIDVDSIEDNECDASTIAYYANENSSRTSKATIASDSIVVYNDQLYGADAASSTYATYYGEKGLPFLGSIKLLDRDGDKKYDVVFIDSYDAYIVSSVSGSTYTIIDNSLRKNLGDNSKLILDPDDFNKTIKYVNKSGNAATFSSITTGSVLCVKESNDGNGGQKLITVVVCNDSISGTVKGTNTNGTIKIDSKEYKSSNLAPWINPYDGAAVVMSEPTMGDSGKFYLDMNGDIIGYDKSAQVSNIQYGYIMQAKKDTKNVLEGEELAFNIITSSGKTIYYAYDNTSINGATFASYTELLDALDDTILPSGDVSIYPGTVDNEDYSQLVKFSTKTYKGKTVIDEIITKTDKLAGEEVKTDELHFFAKDGFLVDDDCEYDSTNKLLEGATKSITLNNALIFRIPEDRADIDDYKKISLNDLKHGEDYKVEFYDVTGIDSAKVVLVYGGASTVGEVTASSPVVVVTDIIRGTDPKGEESFRYHLTGYNGSSPMDYWGSASSNAVFATVTKGDIVRLGTDDDGYATLLPEHIIFSATPGHRASVVGGGYPQSENTSSGSMGYKVIWGSSYQYDKNEGILKVAHNILTGNNDEPAASDVFTMQKSWFNGAKVYEYDTTGSTLEIIEHSSVDAALDSLQTYSFTSAEDYEVPTEIFIHMNSNTSVKTVIIVNR